MRAFALPVLLVSLTCITTALPAHTQDAAPAMQLPPDQKAYHAALASPDADAQIAALQAFIHDFPDSKSVDSARTRLFHLLLGAHPDRVKQIRSAGKAMIDAATPGLDRSNEENTVAFELAEALPNPVDLKSAEQWANDAFATLTLPAYTESMRNNSQKYKFPMPSAEELQREFDVNLGADLQTLADVYFHEGKLDKATAALDRIKLANPPSSDSNFGSVLETRGQIAAAQHRDAEALDDLERAVIYGGLTAQAKPTLLRLYAEAHNVSPENAEAGLNADLDAQYRKLIPPPFTPAPRTTAPTGRTVLLELYTGSACEPCVAADLALDGVLEAYPRNEVVALSFDQHIPEPDPLANADSIARADFYKIYSTPTIMLDGNRAGVPLGGSRDFAGKQYPKLADAIDKQLNTPSGVDLKLNASIAADHTIMVSAVANVRDPAALNKLLSTPAPAAPGPAASSAAAPVPATSVPAAPNLVLNIALVQPTVRYSGENGIRFHSMVVRALAQPAGKGFPVALTGESQASFSFDPAGVSRDLSKYLADFSQHNERFGVVHFLSTDTSLTGPLAIAAWVEDPATHHVVQAAFVPLSASSTEQATR